MNASITNPIYTAVIISRDGIRFNVDKVKTDLYLSQTEKSLAHQANITLYNAEANGGHLSGQIRNRDRLYVYANTGDGPKEKFRGFIWRKEYSSATEKELKLTAYDNLIYLLQSEDNFYFPAGKATNTVITDICSKWGVNFVYEYENISHSILRYTKKSVADCIIETLEEVKKKTGKKYVIYSENDTIHIGHVGKNKTIYQFYSQKNVIDTKSVLTLDGVVTKVVITGNEDKDGNPPVLSTVEGDTATFGTLQRIITKDKETSMEDATKEANELLSEKGKEIEELSIRAVDVPWVCKGDEVYLSAGDLVGYFIVIAIEHDALSKIMSMDVERVT